MNIRSELVPLDHDKVARFIVRRGEFWIAAGLKEIDPEGWARTFASQAPDGAEITSHRSGDRDIFIWRFVRVEIRDALA